MSAYDALFDDFNAPERPVTAIDILSPTEKKEDYYGRLFDTFNSVDNGQVDRLKFINESQKDIDPGKAKRIVEIQNKDST
jgi:hypothetical protein